MLEPYDGKLSCTVLRGESGRKAGDLPGEVAQFYIGRTNESIESDRRTEKYS